MSVQAPAVGLVVPMYDEAARLVEVVGEIVAYVRGLPAGSEVIFVDDGSADGTPELLEDLLRRDGCAPPARVLRRPRQGKGAAVADGLLAVSTPLRAFCDLDLSTPLEDLSRIVAAARRAEVLAVGSRDVAGSTLLQPESPLREGLGRAYNRLLQITVTPGIVDTQCGAKAARAEIWERLLPWCQETGFAWDAELVAVAVALGVEVQELPVSWRHDARSKVRVGRDGLAMVAATPRIWRSARRAAAARPAQAEARAPARGTRGTASAGFDDANAALLLDADRTHWWFRSKAALVATALRRTAAAGNEGGWLVDAGGGAGGVTALLGWAPERALVVEPNEALVRGAVRRHGLSGARGSVAELPLATGSASVVCLLDVIEHLADPVAALAEARRALAPEGRLIVNVPAHRWLWSPADLELGHLRRYTRRSLLAELRAAGFAPLWAGHVFSWLVPPVWLARRALRPGKAELGLDRSSAALDRAAMLLTFAERLALGRVRLPLGTSVLAVAQPSPPGRSA